MLQGASGERITMSFAVVAAISNIEVIECDNVIIGPDGLARIHFHVRNDDDAFCLQLDDDNTLTS